MDNATYDEIRPRQRGFMLTILALTLAVVALGAPKVLAQKSSDSSGNEFAVADFVWPGWLGPKRNGWVSGFQPPAQWPESLKKIWRVEVGIGYGSPLVAGGRVYATPWCGSR